MYFLTSERGMYHTLSDERTGEAPCGARLSKLEVFCLAEGKPSRQVFEEMPEGGRLCKNCERIGQTG